VIIIRIAMNALPQKQKELMQTLLSMSEFMGKQKGCLSHYVFQDIEDENVFCLIDEWETRKDLDDYIKSDRFSVLLGSKSLLYEPPKIQIHAVSHSEGMESINVAMGKRIR